MPVVPFTNREPFEPQRPQMPDEPWALMAAAQMHSEGRLVEPDTKATDERPRITASND